MSGGISLLETRNLTIGYRSKKTFRVISENLNLDLWQGQLVCLLGSNGAGKSTLMRTLGGLQAPIHGEIYIANQRIAQLKPADLARKLSLVLTERIEAGNLTAREVITLGRTPYTGWLGTLNALDEEKISQAVTLAGAGKIIDRKMHQLSDGERQKVMLARALAQDTDVILLDEPTAHLDLPSRMEMMHLLHHLARQTHKAILLSTHELDLALQAADKLWLMEKDGKLTTGMPEDLVLNGTFEAAFARPGFFFDKSTGTFIIQSQPGNNSVSLSGEPNLVFWTGRALQREGFVIEGVQEAFCKIVVAEVNGIPVWEINWNNNVSQTTNIEALIKTIRFNVNA
ncbi:ABC transporter ATP-binding protein [Dyadobacter sediminis]|uniref:ABC transporter ATP-binding protein n=1 Tax=Dyadobacter sediminis TaxID=1493691 RepID=A0A5R9K5M5_9BACT|nr:ABC transporter ATP-binding protein [Dyadobacter sediminis]TLU88855.1 ABC transporter ATP-binding protein [Dyadobacter sediminis]GGC13743.1 iron(III) ABC transporter ATP-binding protein [Dyadobacter sediminis]